MRIRKRSIVGLSFSSWEIVGTSSCTGQMDKEEVEVKEKEFLLPLVAAAMDMQAKEEAKAQLGGEDATMIPTAGHEFHTRPVHNWKNASVQCKRESEAVQVGGEADRSKYRWNGIVRRNPRDTLALFTKEGFVKEGTSSVLKQDMTWLHRDWMLPKLGRPEKFSMWRGREQDLDVGTVTKKRSELDCTTKSRIKRNINANREDAFKMNNKKTVRRNKPKSEGEGHDNENNNNLHAGSQCRRRNGRGWRCSERTLVGYFLCEHHLGKGRFKSINSSKGEASIEVKSKGIKFKELHLIHAAAPPG